MLKTIELISLLFDNFIMYCFLRAMFKGEKKVYFKYDILCAFICSDIIYWLATNKLLGNVSFSATVTRSILTTAICFCISTFFSSNILYKLFTSVSYTILASLCENLSYYILSHFVDTNISFDTLPDFSFTAIYMVSNLIMLLCSGIISAYVKTRNSVHSSIYNTMLIVIPLLSCILSFMPSLFAINYTNASSYLMLIVFLCIINLANYVLLQNVINAEALAREKSVLNQQIAFQRTKYEQLSDAYKTTRSFMHDIKKHLFYIEECVKGKQYDNIIPYTQTTMKDLESRYCTVNTGNLVIDAFVSNALLQAKNNNIRMEKVIKIEKERIPCDDYHMSIILGNLLDNAMTACTGQAGSSIKINIQMIDNSFVIRVANTYHPSPFEASHKDYDDFDFIHGYGLKNVKKSAEQCGGLCVIKYDDGIYSATVIIPRKNRSC